MLYSVNSQFQNKDDLRLGIKDLMETDDVGMIYTSQDIDLLDNVFHFGAPSPTSTALPDELGSICLPADLVDAPPHHCEMTTKEKRKAEFMIRVQQ